MINLAQFEMVELRRCLDPQTVASGGNVQSNTIEDPAKVGRALMFLLLGGDQGAGITALDIKVQGDKKDGSGFVNVKDKDGNDLVFTAAETIGTLANGVLLGTVPLARLDFTDYRLDITSTGDTALLGIGALIVNPHDLPTSQVDDLLDKALPDGATP